MLKIIHIFFVFLSFVSFNSRIAIAQFKPGLLKNRLIKVTPHIIDTFLLISGIALIFREDWLEKEHGWIISKLIMLFFYIIFGIIAMRCSGIKRAIAFITAIGCFVFIFVMAISKQGFIS